jgi:hypothetical protein
MMTIHKLAGPWADVHECWEFVGSSAWSTLYPHNRLILMVLLGLQHHDVPADSAVLVEETGLDPAVLENGLLYLMESGMVSRHDVAGVDTDV